MRHLILSDIHANVTALDAALGAANGRWDRAVCLGDIVDYGPDPNEAVERVISLDAAAIRGNHDKAVVGLIEIEDFNPFAQFSVTWTRDHLRPNNWRFLENLSQGPMSVDGFTIVHGALHDEDEYVFSPSLAVDGLENSPTQVTFFGHTHLQGGFTLRGEAVEIVNSHPPAEQSRLVLPIEEGVTYLLNPGSIGQPRDSDPRAAFAIADIERGSVEFWRVPYDIEAVQSRMSAAMLPEPLILRLSFGR